MEKIKPLTNNANLPPKKPKFKKTSLIIVSLLPIIIIGLSLVYFNQIRTILSFTKVGAEPLYVMTYYGDYGFDDFLKTGKYPDGHPLKTTLLDKAVPWACSVFSARNERGNPILGRNFDWYHHAAVLLFTRPPKGYRSVSLLDPYYCGYLPPNFTPASILDRTKLLTAPWMSMDGMNEYGLAIGLMAVPAAEGSHDPNKLNIGTADVIRLVLDHAKNVPEAIELINQYNVSFAFAGVPVHYLISDAAKHSAVIEFVNGRMEVLQNPETWQVSTNFQIYGTKDGALLCNRYATATKVLKQTNGIISDDNAIKLLKDVSQLTTMWSVVYNQGTGDIQVKMGFDPLRIPQTQKFKLRLPKL